MLFVCLMLFNATFNNISIISWRSLLLAAGLWFSPGTKVSSTSKHDCYDITELLLKVVLNTIILTLQVHVCMY